MNFVPLSASDVAAYLAPRPSDSHKGTYGYIALIGGSLRYSGAAKLANWAACSMRSGAGVVKLAVPRCVATAVAPYLLESTLFPLADDGDNVVFDPDQLAQLIGHTATVAVGMGLGNTAATQEIVAWLLAHFDGNLVLDADGLNALCVLGLDALCHTRSTLFLTPHLGEFTRLLKASGIDASPSADAAQMFAHRYHLNLLLKGPATYVTDGEVGYSISRGCSGMATAGSGDVLSGIAAAVVSNSAAYAAYGPHAPCMALSCAAYINGVAGELAQNEQTPISMVASDTAAHIALAVKRIFEGQEAE